MPSPVQGIFCVLLVVAIAFLTAFALRVAKLYRIYKKNEKDEKNAPQTQSENDTKIYYIQERLPKQRKRKTRRKPQIALSGIVIRPEEFKELMKKHTEADKG